jgi:hypothetical protein
MAVMDWLSQNRNLKEQWSSGDNVQCDELEQVHPRFAMDWVRGVWTSQDQRTEEHTKASESAMAVIDWLSQNWNLKEQWSGGDNVQCDELEQVHPRFAMDRLRGVWTSQDRNLKEGWSGSSSGDVQVGVGSCGHVVGGCG